uniref:UPF3 domain-containing protein n=1 Tax=Electrophorus electricus TaxID=8005 RepID=A0A4W4G273_ELEEL
MKEDKENTRPREKKVEIKCEENEKSEKPNKDKKEAMTKIVIRRLPPSLTKEELEEQLQPLPEVDYLEFFSSDTSLYPHLFARAYLNFKNQEDIVLFRDRFDGYVFIDNRGQEYPAIVEFAPFQKIAKKRSKKRDAKSGTIEEDSDYKKFLELYNGDEEKFSSTPETLLEEIEAKTKELFAKKTTPLLDFLKNKQEKKEERRRRELERKRLREEERRKWREEDRRKRKEAEKSKRGERAPEKDKDQLKEEQPKIKLLKKPDKPENGDAEKLKEKPKKSDREKLKEDRVPGGVDVKRRQNGEHREEKTRRLEEDGRREHRDRDTDREREERERERERRQKEKERIRRQDEERRRRRERHDGENVYKKREEEGRKEKERVWEKRKSENTGDFCSHAPLDKSDKPYKDSKKEESVKRDRLRNKDRPAIQLYQPGARSRNKGVGDSQAGDKMAERDAKNAQEKGEE